MHECVGHGQAGGRHIDGMAGNMVTVPGFGIIAFNLTHM